jgi:two-component system, OmpR family, phosphate regulon sensor histidine kinase PhoR
MADEPILIVDSSVESRAWLIAQVLDPAGYAHIEVSRLDEAHAKISRFRPALIIFAASNDFVAAITFIAHYAASIPIIVIAANPILEDVQAELLAGARDVLVRPLEADRLAKAIERIHQQLRVTQERDTLLAEAKDRSEEFMALHAVGKKTAALLDLEEILTTVVSAAVTLTRAEQGSLMLLDPETGELYLRASQNLAEPGAQRLRIKVNDSLMGQVIQTGQPVVLSSNDLIKIRTSFLVKALLCVPLAVGGKTIGVLSVDNKVSSRTFSDHEVNLLSTFADYAAIAIENSRLYSSAESEHAKLNTMLRDIQDAVIVVDHEMRILLVNKAARDAFKLAEHVVGQPLAEVIHHPRVIDLFDQRKLRVQNWRTEIDLADGRILQGHLSVLSGIGFGAIMQDITRLKELDRIKTEFVSIVSHDLRTPLTTIRGYVSLLSRVGPLNAQQQEFVTRVEDSMTNIVDLIADLLDIGRIEAGLDWEMEPIQLQTVIYEAAQQQQPAATVKHQTLIVKVPNLPPTIGNARRLCQVAANLIGNAIKYTPENGRVEVILREDGDFLVLQVRDTGIGISPEDQHRIFDKFYRVESEQTTGISGSGLGLSIVKVIVEKHGGRVWVESEIGKGSTFTVLLPKHLKKRVTSNYALLVTG